MLIVGSQALVRAIGPVRKPVDFDIFGTYSEAKAFMERSLGQRIISEEVKADKLVLKGSSGAILECELTGDDYPLNTVLHDTMRRKSRDGMHATLDWLYFLKMSHRYRKDSVHFLKTMQDIHLLRAAGARMPEGSEELFKQREKATYTYGHPNLKVDKDSFFKKEDSFYKYDHDTIHEAVAVSGAPAYTHYMQEGEQVMTSKEKFFECPEIIRLRGVLEESYVLALERSLVPLNFKTHPKRAFDMALEKVCTSITSGWFREYAWENYFKVQGMYSPQFVGKFTEALKAGKIKPFQR